MAPVGRDPERIRVFDGFRAYAIGGVVLMHLMLGSNSSLVTSDALGPITWGLFGNVIDVFFIVSGFLMFLPIVRNGGLGDLREYTIGRLARIAPGYWLCLAVVFCLASFASPSPFVVSPDLSSIGTHLLALQEPRRMFDPDFAIGFGLDGPLWMLSIIVGFYVLLPAIARAYLRHPVAGLALSAVISLGWKELALHASGFFAALSPGPSIGSDPSLVAVNQLPGWAFSFALGMTAAWAHASFPRERLKTILLHPATILAAFAIYGFSSYRYGIAGAEVGGATGGSTARLDPLLSLGSSASRLMLMAIVVVGPAWLQRPFHGRPISWMAERSYSLYLIHYVVIVYGIVEFGLPVDGTLPTLLLWIVTVVPVSLAYAQFSLLTVERPALRWLRRRRQPGGGRKRRLWGYLPTPSE